MNIAAHRRSLIVTLTLALAGCMKPNPFAEAIVDGGDETSDEPSDEPSEGQPGALPDLAGEQQGGPDRACMLDGLDHLSIACVGCLSTSCCEAATLCADLQPCACLVACSLGKGAPGACKNQCDAKPEDHPEVALVLACASGPCTDAC